MSVQFNEKLLNQLAEQINTQNNLANLSRQLLKLSIEKVLFAELEAHLGYSKHRSYLSYCLF